MTNMRGLSGLLVGLLLVGCASAPVEPEQVFIEAERVREEPPPPRVVTVPVVHAAPGQARPAPRAEEVSEEDVQEALKRAQERPWETMDAANLAARAQPLEDGYYNAIQVYDYAPGLLYQVYAAQERLTSVEFAPGERVQSVALGDTVRWVVGKTKAGSGSTAREIVLVKPVRSGLKTNAVITTDRRVYQLELTSYRESYMAAVSWAYPADDVLQFWGGGDEQVENPERSEGEEEQEIPVGVNVQNLNFNYGFAVKSPRKPPAWMPVRVFDDGRKTYIQFSSEVRERELPAFFILSRSGAPVVANFRVSGNYMVVDQVFEVAQLRMGEAGDDGESVGIERLGGR